MAFAVYQINLTRSEIEDFNNGVASPRVEAKRNLTTIFDNAELASEVAKVSYQDMYDHVADILGSRDLEDAYYIGNNIPDNLGTIKMHAESMSSLSVGDILEHVETGKLFVVAPFGFEEVTPDLVAAA